jgi:hypothetical protein
LQPQKKIADIIQSEEDVDLAVKMGKWMTDALVAKMTTHLQVPCHLLASFNHFITTSSSACQPFS